MKYTMLLWPHSNVRYQNETLKLAAGELRIMLDACGHAAEILPCEEINMPALIIDTQTELEPRVLDAIAGHSLLYGLFELRADGAMKPLLGREKAYVGADLPGILKYKGKTNELFLQMLVNVALYSGKYYDHADERIELLDPMCGRGTTLFIGANRGWNTTGGDVDKNDLREAENFLKRYFEYHRMKHLMKRTSRTAGAGKSVPIVQFTFADTPQRFKAGETCMLQLANMDAAKVRDVFGKNRFHIIACDLPYGVQHGAVGGTPAQLLERMLPAWRASLKCGGTVAVSFNAQTLKRDTVLELMEKAGLEPMRGGAYDAFEHWVEQAVTRDIAVGRWKG